MGIIIRGFHGPPKTGEKPEAPYHFPGNPPPSAPPKDWEKKLKFNDLLDRQNPMMSLTAAEMLTHTRTSQDPDPKDEAADEAKKRARVAAIKAANKKKSWNSNVSGIGTVLPTLYSYPSSVADQTGAKFSMSDIPSIVWIVLAVAGGIFLIKSAGKGKRR
jgi:hypothetical protein